MSDREKQVRDRAYALWEAEGAPHGRDRHHWEQAELELGGAAPGEGPAEDAGSSSDETTPTNQGVSAQAPSEGATDLPAGDENSPTPTPAVAPETAVSPTAPAEGAPDMPKRRTRRKAAN